MNIKHLLIILVACGSTSACVTPAELKPAVASPVRMDSRNLDVYRLTHFGQYVILTTRFPSGQQSKILILSDWVVLALRPAALEGVLLDRKYSFRGGPVLMSAADAESLVKGPISTKGHIRITVVDTPMQRACSESATISGSSSPTSWKGNAATSKILESYFRKIQLGSGKLLYAVLPQYDALITCDDIVDLIRRDLFVNRNNPSGTLVVTMPSQ